METTSNPQALESLETPSVATPQIEPSNRVAEDDVVMAPGYEGPRQAQNDWRELRERLVTDGSLVLDMSNVTSLERPAVAQIIGFLQDADRAHTRISMRNIPAKTQAMLEILGIHHLVEIQSSNSSAR